MLGSGIRGGKRACPTGVLPLKSSQVALKGAVARAGSVAISPLLRLAGTGPSASCQLSALSCLGLLSLDEVNAQTLERSRAVMDCAIQAGYSEAGPEGMAVVALMSAAGPLQALAGLLDGKPCGRQGQERAAEAAANLAASSKDNRTAIQRAGAIPLLLGLAQQGSSKARQYAVRALGKEAGVSPVLHSPCLIGRDSLPQVIWRFRPALGVPSRRRGGSPSCRRSATEAALRPCRRRPGRPSVSCSPTNDTRTAA